MEFTKDSEQSVTIVLTPEDVESAIMQFICTCEPEYSKGWVAEPVYQLGAAVFHAAKE